MLLFSHLHGVNFPNDDFRKFNGEKTRIGLLRQSRLKAYRIGAEPIQMVSSFVYLKGMGKRGSDVYLGDGGLGYFMVKIPEREWHQWQAKINAMYSKPTQPIQQPSQPDSQDSMLH